MEAFDWALDDLTLDALKTARIMEFLQLIHFFVPPGNTVMKGGNSSFGGQ